MARTTILTKDLTGKIAEAVKGGLPPTLAGAAYHVSADTVREWLRRGEDRDDRPNNEIYAAFAARIRRAESARMAYLLGLIDHASNHGEWRATLAILERQFPEQWAKRRQPAAPSVTIELVLQLTANVLALGVSVEPLQLAGQIAQALGLTSGSSGTLAQTLTVPELNEPAPVPRGRE